MIRPFALDLLGQEGAHPKAGLVDIDVVDDRVRTRQVDILEDTGRMNRVVCALLNMQLTVERDDHSLARLDIPDPLEAQRVECDRLRGDHIVGTVLGLALAIDHRPDAVGVSKADQSIAGDERCCGIATATATMHGRHGLENILRRELQPLTEHQLMGKHVEQNLGVGVGVQMTPVRAVKLLGQRFGVSEVAVVRQTDAVGRVDIERLGLGRGIHACRGITYVPHPGVADQAQHVIGSENVTNQTVFLAQVQTPVFRGHDAGRVLAAMLEYR